MYPPKNITEICAEHNAIVDKYTKKPPYAEDGALDDLSHRLYEIICEHDRIGRVRVVWEEEY